MSALPVASLRVGAVACVGSRDPSSGISMSWSGSRDSLMACCDMQTEGVRGQLNAEKLEGFGGAQGVARQLASACSSQARRNLLCILLDCIIDQAAAVSCRQAPLELILPGQPCPLFVSSGPSVGSYRWQCTSCRLHSSTSAAKAAERAGERHGFLANP